MGHPEAVTIEMENKPDGPRLVVKLLLAGGPAPVDSEIAEQIRLGQKMVFAHD